MADITLPTVAPTAPSKPEVYFIRYKARSEATASAGASASAGATSGGQLIGGELIKQSSHNYNPDWFYEK